MTDVKIINTVNQQFIWQVFSGVCWITRPTCSRALLTSCSSCSLALRALVAHAPLLVSHVPRALHVLMVHVPHTYMLYCYHYDMQPLLMQFWLLQWFFFISDISLEDPLIYVNLTTSIHQSALIGKPALWRAW